MRKVVITDANFPDLSIEREMAADANIELEIAQAETPSEVIESARDADGLLTQYVEIPREVFKEIPDLQVIGRYGIGVDSVDISAATEMGVRVLNVPAYCVDEVSSHAMALILACARKVPQFDSAVETGTWDWTLGKPIHRTAGSTLGLVGFGKIAKAVTKKATGMGLECLVYDPFVTEEEISEGGGQKVEFETLLLESDFLSVHVPLTDQTESLFDERAFERMKESAYIINTARGSVIDTEALSRALDDEEIAGAGLDVLPKEPPEQTELLERNDVILTPHVAWYSEESLIELRRTITEDVLRVLSGEKPHNLVNPDVENKV